MDGRKDTRGPPGEAMLAEAELGADVEVIQKGHCGRDKLDCIICFCSFNLAERLPRKLYCGHTFCQACLLRLDVVLNEQRWIPCPQCRQNTPAPRGGVVMLDLDLASFLAAKCEAESQRAVPHHKGDELDGKLPGSKQEPVTQQPAIWSLETPIEPSFPRSPCCRKICLWCF